MFEWGHTTRCTNASNHSVCCLFNRRARREGDVIVDLDGQRVTGIGDLLRLLTEERIGTETPLLVIRDEEKRYLTVSPEEKEG